MPRRAPDAVGARRACWSGADTITSKPRGVGVTVGDSEDHTAKVGRAALAAGREPERVTQGEPAGTVGGRRRDRGGRRGVGDGARSAGRARRAGPGRHPRRACTAR